MRVDFLIAGTQKGGTSALYDYLLGHPGLCLSDVKETHFFDTEAHFASPQVDYAPLLAHFRPSPGQLLGEATPITMYWADSPCRVWKYNPAMKLICTLRNPIDRAYSHWNMERDRDADHVEFIEALQSEARRCRAALPLQHRVFSYVDRGFYSEQIRRLWRYFPPDQTLILRSEDLRLAPQATLNRVHAFLGVASRLVQPRTVHARPYVGPMSAAAREFLRNVYQWDVRELGRLLGCDFSDWLANS